MDFQDRINGGGQYKMQDLDITNYMKTVLDEIYEGVSICDRDSRILFF